MIKKSMILSAGLMFSVVTTTLPSMLNVIYAEYEAGVLNVDRIDEYLVVLKDSNNYLRNSKSNYEGMFKNGLTTFIGQTAAVGIGAFNLLALMYGEIKGNQYRAHMFHQIHPDFMKDCSETCQNLISKEMFEKLPEGIRKCQIGVMVSVLVWGYISIQNKRANRDYWSDLQIEKNKAIIKKLKQLKEGVQNVQ